MNSKIADSDNHAAFLCIDVQNDFLLGGSLAVPNGEKIIPVCNKVMEKFDIIIFSQDYHPKDHGSFASNLNVEPFSKTELAGLLQIAWPDHCIQGTKGAAFAKALHYPSFVKVVQKGKNPLVDSYGAFCDNTKDGKIDTAKMTDLHEYLQRKRVTHLYLAGLATDFCVAFTALQARELGYEVFVIEDAIAGMGLACEDAEGKKTDTIAVAIGKMKKAGVHFVHSREALASRL